MVWNPFRADITPDRRFPVGRTFNVATDAPVDAALGPSTPTSSIPPLADDVATSEKWKFESPEWLNKAKKAFERMTTTEAEKAEVRKQWHEKRAQDMAEKYGLTDIRAEALALEAAYIKAQAEYHKASQAAFKKKTEQPEQPNDLYWEYATALHKWKRAIETSIILSGDPSISRQEQIAARAITIRDTSLRMSEANARAREGRLDSNEKRAFDGVRKWSRKSGKLLWELTKGTGRLMGKGYEKAGGALLDANSYVRSKANALLGKEVRPEAALSPEEAAVAMQKRARSSRILGAAAFWSTIVTVTGGVAAVPALAGFGIRFARGTIGAVVGYKAAKMVGEKLDQGALLSGSSREVLQARAKEHGGVLKGAFKKTGGDVFALFDDTIVFANSRRASDALKQHDKERKFIEIVIASVAGGGSALLSGAAMNLAADGIMHGSQGAIPQGTQGKQPEAAPGTHTNTQQPASESASPAPTPPVAAPEQAPTTPSAPPQPVQPDATRAETQAALQRSVDELNRHMQAPTPAPAETAPPAPTPEPAERPAAPQPTAEARPSANVQHPESQAPAMPHAGEPGVIDEPGEGTDRAFRELQRHMANTPNQSAVLQHFLNSDVNAISHQVGAEAYGRIGMMTQHGDRFFFDEHQNLMYQPRGGEAVPFLQNDPTAPDGVRVHELHPPHADAVAGTPASTGVVRPVENQVSVTETNEPRANVATPMDRAADAGEVAQRNQAQPPVRNAPGSEVAVDRAPVANTGSVESIDDFVARNTTGVTPADVQPNPPSTPSTTPPLEGGRAPELQPLDEWTRQHGQAPTSGGGGGGGGGGGAESLSWTPEQGLPQEPAVLTLNPESDLAVRLGLADTSKIFYAHAPSPEASLALAQEYGLSHPGVQVFFDNSKYDWLGGKTPQVGSITFANKFPTDFRAQVLDQSGEPIRNIEASQLSSRIV